MGQSAKPPTTKAAKGDKTDGDAQGALDLRQLAEYSVIGLFALAGVMALRYASSLFVPMVAAVVVGTILARLGDRVQRLGVPPAVAAIGLVALVGAGLFFLAQALSAPISSLIERLPDLAEKITGAINRITSHVLPLNAPAAARAGQAPAAAAGGAFDMGWIGGLFTGLTPALGEILIFLATLFFFVTGRTELRKRLVLASDDRDRRLSVLRIINSTEGALAHYFGTTAAVYASVGVATAGIAWIAGLPTPLLWGVFAFVASFIPFLGPAVTAAALASGGLMAFDSPLRALLPAGVYAVAHLVTENALMPSLVGRRFEINPFLVFISIVFWTWMWGATGAVLATPLLIVARTIHSELIES